MRICMNILCGATSSGEWKAGWRLRSGQSAILCDKCGYAFEQRLFCEEFHSDDSGWRNCVTCGKRLHCGCIASFSLIELLDDGGVKCVGCAIIPVPNSNWNGGKNNEYGMCTVTQSSQCVDSHKESNGSNQFSMVHNLKTSAALGTLRQEGPIFPSEESVVAKPAPPPLAEKAVISTPWKAGSPWASTLSQPSMGSFLKGRLDFSSNNMQTKNNYGSVAHPNLNISLGDRSGNLQFTSGTIIDEREQRKMSNAFNQGFLSPSLVQSPPPPQLPFFPPFNSNMSATPKSRGRPPSEGRTRSQLLPRYWPRITDQELKQICGDSNCTIVPLFEKMLSASDAGRIGRLVLPKACAEAYFPRISQAEGLPIKIQDVKGKEWVFQFRFWPNNNSRMYVLEGVTPCIQWLELQAGDTVTFSRKEPEGIFVMGFRKSSNSPVQDQSVANGGSGLPQSIKDSASTHINDLSSQLDSANGNANLHNIDKFDEVKEEGLLPPSMMKKGRKRGQNIGAKNKRLIIDNQDVQELKLTWEEVQGLLRAPPKAKPTTVVIDGFEIEVYDEPPVIGKSSVFAAHSSGMIDQWAQCDSCSKWRRLPAEFLIPPKWTCADNAWDSARCSCSAPDELSPGDLEKFSNLRKDLKKKKKELVNGATQEQESTGLSALANAAVLGDDVNEAGTSATATTTKHPRHRAGCTCIVCIQPPSGKGKHKSTCSCAVCMTVKRRFKTLMMRKKKRHSDEEAGKVRKCRKKNFDKDDDKDNVDDNHSLPENDSLQTELAHTDDGEHQKLIDDNSSSLDLNCHPVQEEESKAKNAQTSLANLSHPPLESCMNQMSLNSPTSEEQASSEAHPGVVAEEIEGQQQHSKEVPVIKALQGQVNPSEGISEPEKVDKHQSDP